MSLDTDEARYAQLWQLRLVLHQIDVGWWPAHLKESFVAFIDAVQREFRALHYQLAKADEEKRRRTR